jgi:N-acetylglucosaminyldiphosphoundecaprenol N-acetyl-beta-D-mannosaminyltransferase
MKVVLSGYYGFGNVGDEAVLEAILQGLRSREPDIRITVLSRGEWNKVFFEILRADVFISGGGTLFQNVTSRRSLVYYLGLVLLAKLLRKRTMVFAQGLGPLRGFFSRTLTRLILNRVDLITLRDKVSFHELQKLGVRRPRTFVTADPSLILIAPPPTVGQKCLSLEGVATGKPLLGVAVRSVPRRKEEGLYRSLAEAIDRFCREHGFFAVFVLFHFPEDLQEASKVIAHMQEQSSVIFRICRPAEMLSVISQFDLFVGMRLHSLIFAAMNRIPVLGLSYDPKVRAFMKKIDQPYLSIDQNLNAESLSSALEKILKDREIIKADLALKCGSIRDQAVLNFDLFFRFLKPFPEVVDFAGVKVDNLTLAEAAARTEELVRSSGPHLIVTPNPEIIVAAQKDSELRGIVNSSSLRVPDGVSMVVVSRILRAPLKERVSGIDLMLSVLELCGQKGYKVFLLGGAPGVAEEAAGNLTRQFQGLNIVGTHHGFFEKDIEVIKKIRDTKPDVLFVGLGAGRQEKWLKKHLGELGVPVGMVIGGSLDVLSGRKKRAPRWVRRLYIEWLYRLFTEPSRWKRQLALPKFLYLTLVKKVI